MKRRTRLSYLPLLLALSVAPTPALAQRNAAPLARFGEATELPVGPWGLYSTRHLAPCFLADRADSQLFAFPLVIGQRRIESQLRLQTLPDGKKRTRLERIALERRMIGMAPLNAETDDLPAPADRSRNRRLRLHAASPEGGYWRLSGRFLPAALSPQHGRFPGATPWSEGEVTVECFPVHAFQDAEGALVRVTIVNRSQTPQTYFADLLGGLDASAGANVAAEERQAEVLENGVALKQRRNPIQFGLWADAPRRPTRFAVVSGGYFAASPRPVAVAPDGRTPLPGQDAKPEKDAGVWGLVRVDEINLAPGETATVTFGVGAHKDQDTAIEAAQQLAQRCDDHALANRRDKTPGLLTLAKKDYDAHRFRCANDALNELMALTFGNVCFDAQRRIGVPSRQPTHGMPGGAYQVEAGGAIALAWMDYRPEWAVAQLNAHFLTQRKANAPHQPPAAIPPMNLFALWELYQRTHDRALLRRFYPFAARRYRELVTAGVRSERSFLFSWTDGGSVYSFLPESKSSDRSKEAQIFAPDYSAYVIRAARILRIMAQETAQTPEVAREWDNDIADATRALQETLWNPVRGLFVPRPLQGLAPGGIQETLAGILPLLAGSAALTKEQRDSLLRHLNDPATFASDGGVRTISKQSARYRPDIARTGAVHYQLNWMLWKALLDFGEAEQAQALANRLLTAYTKTRATTGGYPERLNGDTGAGEGEDDYTGEACVLFPMYHAYHTPGTVTTGWDTFLAEHRYDATADTMRLTVRAADAEGKGTLLCVMGKPNAAYDVQGAYAGTFRTDANGVLTLTAPKSIAPQALTIAPAPEEKKP